MVRRGASYWRNRASRALDNTMKPILQTLAATAMAALTLCFAAPQAFAQGASDLVGSWSLVSLTVVKSGSEVEALGPHPQGQLIFGSDGRYVIVGLRADLPKFAADNRLSGSAEENQRIVQGSFAHFGTYTVDSPGHVIVFHIQNSTFPNWDDDVQRRPFTLEGDRLTYVTPGSFGYGASRVSWQRMK
jgi:Lipocalin-like domain